MLRLSRSHSSARGAAIYTTVLARDDGDVGNVEVQWIVEKSSRMYATSHKTTSYHTEKTPRAISL